MRYERNWKDMVKDAIALCVVFGMLCIVAWLFYLAYFAPCPAGTTLVTGWSGGNYVRLCVPQ